MRSFALELGLLSEEIDRLLFLATLQQDLLLLDCLTLSHKLFCFLQGQVCVYLETHGLRLIMNSHYDAITDHLILEITVLTVLRQVVQACDELFCDSLSPWQRWLNRARSKMTLFRPLKMPSNRLVTRYTTSDQHRRCRWK